MSGRKLGVGHGRGNQISSTFTITATSGANGTVSPLGVTVIAAGGSQLYTITDNVNYHILDVLVDGVSVGAVGTYNFTNVQANHTISATFAIDTYTITASTGPNGTISPLGATVVNAGGSQLYTITDNANYHILDVLVDGVSVGAVTSYNFTNVLANHTIASSFAIDTYNIVSTQGSNGTIVPLGTTAVNHGASQSYTIAASALCDIFDVEVDAASVGVPIFYDFTNVTAAHTIDATFAEQGTSLTLVQSTHIFPNTPPPGWAERDVYICNPSINQTNFNNTSPAPNAAASVLFYGTSSVILASGSAYFSGLRTAVAAVFGAEGAYWHIGAARLEHTAGTIYHVRPSALLGSTIATYILNNTDLTFFDGLFADEQQPTLPNSYLVDYRTADEWVEGDLALVQADWIAMVAAFKTTFKASVGASKALLCNVGALTEAQVPQDTDGITLESGHFAANTTDGSSQVSNSSTNNPAGGYTSSAITPTANDLVFVWVNATGCTDVGTMTDTWGLGMELLASVSYNAGADKLYLFGAEAPATSVSGSVTFCPSGVTATGCTLSFRRVPGYPGMTAANLIRTVNGVQQLATNSGLAGTTPGVTMPVAFAINMGVLAVGNGSGGTDDLAAPGGWFTTFNANFATPDSRTEGMRRNSGETASAINLTVNSTTAWGMICMEVSNPSEARARLVFQKAKENWMASAVKFGTGPLSCTWNVNNASDRTALGILSGYDSTTWANSIGGVYYNGTSIG